MIAETPTLRGRFVTLTELSQAHAESLYQQYSASHQSSSSDQSRTLDPSCDANIWRYLPMHLQSLTDFEQWIESRRQLQQQGLAVSFAVLSNETQQAVGSTSYINLAPEHARLEIGMTWLVPSVHRTGINREMKRLMIDYAFNELKCQRVEFKTDARNQRSRNALGSLGAIEEGTLRNHMVYPNGERRDTVYFSILPTEWPSIRQRLSERIDR